MNVINLLMRQPTVVLQDIVVLGTRCFGNALRNGEDLGETVVRDVCQLCTVVFGDDKLQAISAICLRGAQP